MKRLSILTLALLAIVLGARAQSDVDKDIQTFVSANADYIARDVFKDDAYEAETPSFKYAYLFMIPKAKGRSVVDLRDAIVAHCEEGYQFFEKKVGMMPANRQLVSVCFGNEGQYSQIFGGLRPGDVFVGLTVKDRAHEGKKYFYGLSYIEENDTLRGLVLKVYGPDMRRLNGISVQATNLRDQVDWTPYAADALRADSLRDVLSEAQRQMRKTLVPSRDVSGVVAVDTVSAEELMGEFRPRTSVQFADIFLSLANNILTSTDALTQKRNLKSLREVARTSSGVLNKGHRELCLKMIKELKKKVYALDWYYANQSLELTKKYIKLGAKYPHNVR